MLLPKRIEKHKTQNLPNKKTIKIQDYVNLQPHEDSYILDEENAIIIKKNEESTISNLDYHYIMIHERLENNKLLKINSWFLRSYHFGFSKKESVIHPNLFKVRDINGFPNSLYDFKKGEFVVPCDTWDKLEFGRNNNFLTKYNNGILASFEIFSDYEKDDIYSYTNPYTKEKITESFAVRDGNYYAILNLDGTIRGNKLFKGKNFSTIEPPIIDLGDYESLEAFKQERKNICNEIKQRNKQHYKEMIAKRNDGSISPYLDSEVMRILEMKE